VRGNFWSGAQRHESARPRRSVRDREQHRIRAHRRIFSRSPANIERAKAEIVAGNVYVNRSCTRPGRSAVIRSAVFKMSGGGTKAGGRIIFSNSLCRAL